MSSPFFSFLIYLNSRQNKKCRFLRFIKSFISNPDQYRKDDIPILLTNSVKYELTLFSKYNDLSIVEYAIELAYAQDFQQRTSAVEFLSKILVTESRARQGGDDPVTDHREQKVLEILILKTIDKKDGVKLKALNGLQKAFSEGNAYTQRLLNATFDKNSDNDAFLLVGRLSRESIKKLIFTLIHLAQTNKSPYVRKSSIALLDVIGRRDESLIQNEDLARLVSTLPDDTSILVRSQTIEMLTGWLEKYPTNRKLLELWVDVILSLLEDDEARIKASAMKSLFSNVFTKIVAYEDSVSYASYTPWIIIQTIIEKDRRDVLINAIETSKPDALTANKIRIIENHIYSSKCTEGFVLLSVISGKLIQFLLSTQNLKFSNFQAK